jgi:hypothetical protein
MRTFSVSLLLLFCFAGFSTPGMQAQTKKDSSDKEKLQALQEFIGPWEGAGTIEGKSDTWKEKLNWGWKFKDKDAWYNLEFDKSKNFAKGEIRFNAEKKGYQLTLTDLAKTELVFDGEMKRKQLIFTRVDEQSKDKQTITLSTNNEGARMIWVYSVMTKGKGIDKKLYNLQYTKEGQSLAAGKKNECVVTGGLGTMQVSYMGKTYFVCCSGCRDAFNDDPKKFVDEFEKKKK